MTFANRFAFIIGPLSNKVVKVAEIETPPKYCRLNMIVVAHRKLPCTSLAGSHAHLAAHALVSVMNDLPVSDAVSSERTSL